MDLKEVAKDIVKGLNTFENVSSAIDKISHGYENNQIEIVYRRLLEKKVKELLKENKMKKIIMEEESSLTIDFENVDKNKPVFCKKDGELIGMFVNENDEGWKLILGGSGGTTSGSYHKTLKRCIESAYAEGLGFEFYVN